MSLFCALVCLVTMAPAPVPAPQVELLHFESEGCAACRTMAPTVERLSKTGLTIRHIDISEDPDTKDKYQVRVVPSFVVLVDGEERDRLEGTASFDRLNSVVVRVQRAEVSEEDIAAPSPPKRQRSISANMGSNRQELELAENAGNVEPPSKTAAQIRQTALNSTVRIRIEDKPGMIAYGTGTIIDARNGEALVITCGHLFRDSGGQGKITVDAFVDGAKRTVKARVLDYDLEYEVGLLIIESGGNVEVSRVANKEGQPQPGQPLFSVGCSNGADPTVMEMQVTAIDRFTGAPNIECTGSPIEGRSGGGLFDESGRLVAICFGRLDGEPRGAYSGLPTVHWLLTKHNFDMVFEDNSTPSASESKLVADNQADLPVVEDRLPVTEPKNPRPSPRRESPPTAGKLVAAQETPDAQAELAEPFTPPAKRSPRSEPSRTEVDKRKPLAKSAPTNKEIEEPQTAPSASRSRLGRVLDEQLSKLDPSAEDAELICIVKSKGGPTAKHKVLVLDSPSPEFLKRLAQERQALDLISSLPNRRPAPAQLARSSRSGGAKIAKLQENAADDAQ